MLMNSKKLNQTNETDNPDITVHSKCLRCNRPLKDPESQKIGMGKTCLAKYRKEESHKKLF